MRKINLILMTIFVMATAFFVTSCSNNKDDDKISELKKKIEIKNLEKQLSEDNQQNTNQQNTNQQNTNQQNSGNQNLQQNTTQQQTSDGTSAGQNNTTNGDLISAQGTTVIFNDAESLFLDIPDYNPQQPVVWLTGETVYLQDETKEKLLAGNGWGQGGDMQSLWAHYSLQRGNDGKYTVNNPGKTMGTLGQIDRLPNGRVRIRWIDLRKYFGNRQIYDNRSDDNKRCCLNIPGVFEPEYIKGKPVQQDIKTGQPIFASR